MSDGIVDAIKIQGTVNIDIEARYEYCSDVWINRGNGGCCTDQGPMNQTRASARKELSFETRVLKRPAVSVRTTELNRTHEYRKETVREKEGI